MVRSRLFGFIALAIVVAILFFTASCFGGTSVPSGTPTPSVTKPRPVIESVTAVTSGEENNYYVILEIKVKNAGSDGTAKVSGTVTQGGKTQTNEMVTSIDHNSSQIVRLVFPLKWEGGDWTQTVKVEVP